MGALEQRDEVDAIVRTALKVGVNFIDTADVCSFGASEQRLARPGAEDSRVAVSRHLCPSLRCQP
ncbi:aldo/keto reductase [Burkholderia ubonensis]|uniref:aldo/keto reductase n=1 Tax=Burkholderia ubonensis TaxID=101571 RepID=UPI00211BE680|nr:aldo/keto reductase [Burkholderia ubonensis]